MSIRERLELITPLLKPRLQPPARREDFSTTTSARNFPPISMVSPHFMQILGLPSDLASLLYRLEAAVSPVVESSAEPACINSPELILHRFQEQFYQWFPVLHPDFTIHFFETNAAGFPHSTKACLSLLVSSLASLGHGQLHRSNSDAAFSMLPIVIQECSVTSAQCLVLFSLYFASLLQPRQAYTYIRLAFLKIQPLVKSPYLTQEPSEITLTTRLYWTIYLMESEISMHLNLTSGRKLCCNNSTTIPLPTSAYMWDCAAGSNTPWRSSPFSGTPPSGQGYLANSHLATEIHLQLVLNNHTSPVAAAETSSTEANACSSSPLASLQDTLLFPHTASHATQFDHTHQISESPVCLAKYHLYEVSAYWPVIYRIILDGIADSELLPYGPLFFECVTSFLGAAQMAIAVCPAKTWFLCASMYTISMAAVRALEVSSLRLLAQSRFWGYLEAAVDAMRGPSELSPSIRYMRESLRERLDMLGVQRSV
ncbi:hypothetical protein BJX63DRAFT_223885 [Aspergillus granulosus]|uniref:Xylanolytic transcriptional activator regulatory domain-containing protein n=1 Tax=Aspergillus granulosus TaxID=176169 RepID=A0ABR4I1Q7_9EURO